MPLTIFKFGGSSVRDAAHIDNVCQIIGRYNDTELLIVISAVGKTTNALEKAWELYIDSKEAGMNELQKIVEQHIRLAKELGLDEADTKSLLETQISDSLSSLPSDASPDLYYDLSLIHI